MPNNGDRPDDLAPQMNVLELDMVKALALELGPLLNGKDLGLVQATLVLSWLMTTGALMDIMGMDEKNARASVFIQKGTDALGRLVNQVMGMTQGEVDIHLQMQGDVPGLRH